MKRNGFTLIELSIVLVIIGLIAAGIVAGRELIESANVRNAVGQIGRFNTATNTFQNKYKALPGDILTPDKFGLYTDASCTGTPNIGNADGRVISFNTTGFFGEPALFFFHLQQANLTDTYLIANLGDDPQYISCSDSERAIINANIMPILKLGVSNFVHIDNAGGGHYYVTSGVTMIQDGSGEYTERDSLTPIQAYQFDSKLDDGNPHTGKVAAIGSSATPLTVDAGSGSPVAGDCVNTATTPVSYAAVGAAQVALGCIMRVQTPF